MVMAGANIRMVLRFAVFSMCVPSVSFAAEWRFSQGDPNKSVQLYDSSSVDKTTDVNEVWFETAYFIDRADKVFNEKTLWRFNCFSKKLSLLESISFDYSGNILKSPRVPEQAVSENRIVPDSSGDSMFRKVCEQPNLAEAQPVRSAGEAAKIYRKIRRSYPVSDSFTPFSLSLFMSGEACQPANLGIQNLQNAAAVCRALD